MALAMKFLVGGLVMALIGGVAQQVGGRLGGLLAGFPAVFLTSVGLAGWHAGPAGDIALARMVAVSLAVLLGDVALVHLAPRILARARWWYALPGLVGLWAAGALPLGWLALRLAG